MAHQAAIRAVAAQVRLARQALAAGHVRWHIRLVARLQASRPRLWTTGLLLRLEGGVALAAALILYGGHGGGWLLFALLFLAPDLSVLGYLAGPAVGAACYNAAHTYLVPVVLGAGGLVAGQPLAVTLALIWGAHIGWDRLLGYGLKSTDASGHIHLVAHQARRDAPASSRSASAGGPGVGMA